MKEMKLSLRQIFNEAAEIADPKQRGEYLAQACGADTALRRSVEELIEANNDAGRFLGGAGETAARVVGVGLAGYGAIARDHGRQLNEVEGLELRQVD